MPVVKITKENLDTTLEQNGIILIKFTASWCGPCQSFAPVYAEVAEKFPDVVFAEINTETEPELAADFSVRSVPFLMVLRDKILIYSDSGTLPASSLEDLVNQAKALDMSELKQKTKGQESSDA